ncbi:MAG: hypothetical protein QM647_10770 [Asticcacaulis sp.]|uniref:hypothetical protein n=1 Tax=Asticcacaulis sp. TaxID=1872648 RepID=UPI0039E35BA7
MGDTLQLETIVLNDCRGGNGNMGRQCQAFLLFLRGGHIRGLGYAPNVARALNAPLHPLNCRSEGCNCGQKMKLIYALQVCGLGEKVYKGLILR